MDGLYPIVRRVRRPLVPVDVEPPRVFAVEVKRVVPEGAEAVAPAPPAEVTTGSAGETGALPEVTAPGKTVGRTGGRKQR
jgi:hypothetical protein